MNNFINIVLVKIKEAAEKAVITAKPTIVREPTSKPTNVSSNSIEKKSTTTINKNTVVRRTRTAINIPSKTTVNSKAKKPMSAPGIFLTFNIIFNTYKYFILIILYYQVVVNHYHQKIFLQLKLKMKLVMMNWKN
jgi:hypothetical protein